MAASARIGNYARALKACGINVKVVIAKRTEVYGRHPANTEADGLFYDISYHYVSGTPLRSRGLFMRSLRDFLDVFATLRFLKRELTDGDAVIGYLDGHPFLVTCLLSWCRFARIKFVSELCEYPYEADNRLSLKDKMERQYVMNRLFPRFDGVIAISEYLASFARTRCSPDCRMAKVPILVDFEAFDVPDRSELEPVPYVFHCGTLYDKKDGYCDMLEAFGRALRDYGVKARFVSTGSIAEAQNPVRVMEIIKEYHMESQVEFIGYVQGNDKRDWLSRAALVIINKPDNLQNRSGFSTKLGEYLAAGKAIIHTRVGEAQNYLEDGKNARLVPCGDVAALAAAISSCLSDMSVSRRMGEEGKALCRSTFDFRCNGERILEAIL